MSGFSLQMLKLRADHMQEKEDIQVFFSSYCLSYHSTFRRGYKLMNRVTGQIEQVGNERA
jgi:hypothetical protein